MTNEHLLSDDIISYIESLVTDYPDIESIWLFGSRANETYRDDSDWDLLVFGNELILQSLKNDTKYHKKELVDLLIVYNGNECIVPWSVDGNKPKVTSLKRFDWKLSSPTEATYTDKKLKETADSFRENGILYVNYTFGNPEIMKTVKSYKLWP